MSKKNSLIDRLNSSRPHTCFVAATDEVVAGFDLVATGNRSYGSNVFVATGAPPDVADSELDVGRVITPGSVERIKGYELRCVRAGKKNLSISLHDRRGRLVGRRLTARGGKKGVDEGRFTWFGPVENICTPWNDGDDSQCQVVTVARLRRFARGRR